MAYLIACDASCCEAGPILSDAEDAEEVVSRRRDARRKFNRKRKRAAGVVHEEIEIILSNPEHFILDSGYTWYALLVALPRGTSTVHDAIKWLSTRSAEQWNEALIDFDGAHLTPTFPGAFDEGQEPPAPSEDGVDSLEALEEVVEAHADW